MGGALIIMALAVGDGAVVRPAQHAGLAGAAGHRRLRRHRLRRRLPEALAEEQEGPARQAQAARAVRRSAPVAMVWLYHGDALPPRCALRLALPLVNFHHMSPRSSPGPRCRSRSTSRSRVFVLMSESNAVNLTDGLDGLAIGPVIICSFTFLFLAYAAGTTLRGFNIADYLGMPTCRARASWPCSAAPWAAPASASSGSTPTRRRCSWATSARWRWAARIGFVGAGHQDRAALPIIGGVFVAEAVSDIIQVAYYKNTEEAHLPDGADPPPLREAGVARVQHRGAFLDRLVRLRDSRAHHHPQGADERLLDLDTASACWWSVSGAPGSRRRSCARRAARA